MLVAAAALAAACCTLVGVYEGASNWTIVMVRCLHSRSLRRVLFNSKLVTFGGRIVHPGSLVLCQP
jgi:hypothetical protein